VLGGGTYLAGYVEAPANSAKAPARTMPVAFHTVSASSRKTTPTTELATRKSPKMGTTTLTGAPASAR
jgi:hypothetical protein